MYISVNHTSATSYNYDATIAFFLIAQQVTQLSILYVPLFELNWPT